MFPDAFADLLVKGADESLSLRARLADEGLAVLGWADVGRHDRTWLSRVFAERAFPALTPLTADATHPFPQPASLSLNLAMTVADEWCSEERFVAVQIPPSLPRLLPVAGGVIPLEEVMAAHLDRVLPGVVEASVVCFWVVRSSDRGLTPVTRLDLGPSADDRASAMLLPGLGATEAITRRVPDTLLVGPDLVALCLQPVTSRAQGGRPRPTSRVGSAA